MAAAAAAISHLRIDVFLQLKVSWNRLFDQNGSGTLTVQTPPPTIFAPSAGIRSLRSGPDMPLKTGFCLVFRSDVRTSPVLRQVWPTRSG
jgi:hypothetical protein